MLKKIYLRLKQKGQGVVEYALLLGVVAILTLAFFQEGGLTETFGKTLSNIVGHFTRFNDAYDEADDNEGGGTEGGGTEGGGGT